MNSLLLASYGRALTAEIPVNVSPERIATGVLQESSRKPLRSERRRAGHLAGESAVSAASVSNQEEAQPDCPALVAEFADRALAAVKAAVGLDLEFDSDTLPLVDHYLRELPGNQPETAALIAAMVGSYFGETVRRCHGGRWKTEGEDPASWRIVMPGGLSFSPVRLALAAILEDESGEGNPDFQAPPLLMAELEKTLERMGAVTSREYYALSCRFDTLEHLQEVMLAFAAEQEQKSKGLPN